MAGKGGKRATSWRPGQSGNPHGRPKIIAEVRDLARQYTADAMDVLTGIMNDPKAPSAARVSAASAVLDRGWGKPGQAIDADVNVVPPDVQRRREATRDRVMAMLKRMESGWGVRRANGPLTDEGLDQPEPAPAQLANGHADDHDK